MSAIQVQMCGNLKIIKLALVAVCGGSKPPVTERLLFVFMCTRAELKCTVYEKHNITYK